MNSSMISLPEGPSKFSLILSKHIIRIWSKLLTFEELMKQGHDLPLRDDQWKDGKLVVQDDNEQGTVNVQSAVVVKEPRSYRRWVCKSC